MANAFTGNTAVTTQTTTSTADLGSEPASPAPVTLASLHPTHPTQAIEDSPAITARRRSLSWKSIRSAISISEKTSAQLGWAIACLSVIFAIVALSPAYKSQNLSVQTLKLAEWTALKDFIEECREELAAGIHSQACLKATSAALPPPPDIDTKVFRRNVHNVSHGAAAIGAQRYIEQTGLHVFHPIQGVVLIAVILIVWTFFYFRSEKSPLQHPIHPYDVEAKDHDASSPSIHTNTNTIANSSTIRYPANFQEANLRRRPIRTHPIYRHATLGSAIHAEDIQEIRMRAENGEDIHEHWPYLIYQLAITPRAELTPKRLDIARLLLDFGADVNALKAWNGESALTIAIHFGNVDVAKLLIANGAMVRYSPSDSRLSPLNHCVRLAAKRSADDALEIMKMLFDYGADANQPDRVSETPLHKVLVDAWYNRHDEIFLKKLTPLATYLVEHGARIPENIKEKYTISNPLWELVYFMCSSSEWPDQIGPDDTLTKVARSLKEQALMEADEKRRL